MTDGSGHPEHAPPNPDPFIDIFLTLLLFFSHPARYIRFFIRSGYALMQYINFLSMGVALLLVRIRAGTFFGRFPAVRGFNFSVAGSLQERADAMETPERRRELTLDNIFRERSNYIWHLYEIWDWDYVQGVRNKIIYLLITEIVRDTKHIFFLHFISIFVFLLLSCIQSV